MIYAQRLYECLPCQLSFELWHWDYERPSCPQCLAPLTLQTKPTSHGIICDDIPGGLDVRHAICNPDGSPKRYYSKSAIREAARKAGWTIDGETPQPRERREV
jgi:hypothetical protein